MDGLIPLIDCDVVHSLNVLYEGLLFTVDSLLLYTCCTLMLILSVTPPFLHPGPAV